ncbi:MAG TPA: diiron oxygenase [Kofleriaceae bacterium]|nr:diiron oxygenase [Kofleriaceae bacterium]
MGIDTSESLLAGRWAEIDWAAPVPADYLIPEHHYRLLDGGLTRGQRIRLNHLAVCFSCELFIHFEHYLIGYLERHGERAMPRRARDRFVAEERAHVEAFYRLLAAIRPDLYPGRALRFLDRGRLDDLLIAATPTVSFFLLAALFEEITLHVPVVMEEQLAQSFRTVLDVMRLHADEERSHVKLDERVLAAERARRPGWQIGGEVLLVLPLLYYLDRAVTAGWRRAVDQFAGEESIGEAERQRLLGRPGSRSDLLGMASFAGKLRASGLAGAGLVARVIEAQAR